MIEKAIRYQLGTTRQALQAQTDTYGDADVINDAPPPQRQIDVIRHSVQLPSYIYSTYHVGNFPVQLRVALLSMYIPTVWVGPIRLLVCENMKPFVKYVRNRLGYRT